MARPLSPKPGEKFHRLTVLSRTTKHARCLCDCGNIVTPQAHTLKSGVTKSCGCLNRETLDRRSATAQAKNAKKQHDLALAREQRTIKSAEKRKYARAKGRHKLMLERCYNPSHSAYKYYGARGITVHEAWRHLDGFLADMGYPPEGMTLDRVDNDRNYEPGNCRWATRDEQARNRRNNLYVDQDGARVLLIDVCKSLKLPYQPAQKIHQGLRLLGENPPHFSHFQSLAQKHAQPS